MPVKVGDKAPEFSLLNQNAEKVSISDFKGQNIVLYFYPKNNTSGCTKEACNFRDDYDLYTTKDVVILGVSPDGEKSHRKFTDKFSLPFPLLSDEDKAVSTAYGAWGEKSMYGRKYMGIIRKTFLIDREGNIERIWHKVKVKAHSREILELLGD